MKILAVMLLILLPDAFAFADDPAWWSDSKCRQERNETYDEKLDLCAPDMNHFKWLEKKPCWAIFYSFDSFKSLRSILSITNLRDAS